MSIISKLEDKVKDKVKEEVKTSIFKKIKKETEKVLAKAFKVIDAFLDFLRKVPVLNKVINYVISKTAPNIIQDDKVKLWNWLQSILKKGK